MKAVMKFADGVRLGDVERRELAAGQVRIDVAAAGVCGTDLHIADDSYPNSPPVVMGHEISGTVTESSDGDSCPWVGRRVVVETYYSTCENCPYCRDGRRNLCSERRSLGSFANGGFAKEVVVPVRNLHELPDHVDAIDGVLMEPLACVTNCLLDPSRIQAGDEVLVLGPGTMGLLAVQVALAAGARVVVSGLAHDARKLALAQEFGAEIAGEISPDRFDVVINTTGSAAATTLGLQAAAKGANFVEMGIAGQTVSVPWDLILYKELQVTSGFASTPRSWRRAVRLVDQGLVSLDGLVTARFPLDEWKDAFAAVGGVDVKIVLIPT